jgi:hypothetical protein
LQTYTYDIRPIKDNSVSQPLMVMATNAAAPATDRGNTVPAAASSMTTANGSNVHSYEVSWTAAVFSVCSQHCQGSGKDADCARIGNLQGHVAAVLWPMGFALMHRQVFLTANPRKTCCCQTKSHAF